ncbi:substrate-binding domain-containing protein [Neolewinella lacunae]|uniref:Substrate-binding domain-containing protein n=1 Tax=Neolewinella lacunae TaxID=1517758 RepID=A0A923T7U1_9BACT|nr:substrate-binding domain-containing protein [Neolewinella lacunae]MBC6993909.1 substrate-binding domain-containing protein [Neolewinella lacunae]MDN3635009.1 substrate-binding domain-containing protein [Neolewinella lacunae]
MGNYFTIFLRLLVFLALSSCGSPAANEALPAAIKIGFSQCCNDGWRDVMNKEVMREASLHPEVSVLFRGSSNNSREQIAHIKGLIEEGIDVLLVSPNESAPLTPVLEDAYKAGIPVVLIDRKIESNLYTAFIGADNYEVGRTAGQYLAGKFPAGGNIMAIEIPETISPGMARTKGFSEGISANPGLRIVRAISDDIVFDNPDSLRRMIVDSKDIDIVFSHTDVLAEKAHSFAQENGLEDSLFFIGIDGIPGSGRGIEAVKDGILDASVLYPTGGDEAVRLIMAILQGLPYQKENKLETIVIEPSNATILHNQMKRVDKLQVMIDEEISLLASLQATYRSQRVLITVLLAALLGGFILAVSLFRSLRTKQAANASLQQKNREILESQRQLKQLAEQMAEADEVTFNEDKPFDVEYFISRIQRMLLKQQRNGGVNPEEETAASGESKLDQVLRKEELLAEDHDFLQRMAAYVEAHYADSDFKATDLCQELGVSRSHLYRKVKELMGEGVISYVENVRLRNAERLLLDTNDSIAEIAYSVGYSTPEYFAKVFKARYQLSPSGFRDRHRQGT